MHIRRQGQGGVDPGQCEVEPCGEEDVQGNLVVIVMIVKEGKTYLWKTLWEVVQWWNLHQCSPLPRSSSRWSGPGCCQLSDQPCFPIRSKYRRNFIHFKPIQFEQVKEIVSESPFPLDWTWPPCLHKAQLCPPLQSYWNYQFIFWFTKTWFFPSVRQKSRIFERLDNCSLVCQVFHHPQIQNRNPTSGPDLVPTSPSCRLSSTHKSRPDLLSPHAVAPEVIVFQFFFCGTEEMQ